MTTLADLLYVVLFAVALPLFDHFVSWPAFQRQSRTDPALARRRSWTGNMATLWALVAAGAVLWLSHDRSWTSFGFSVPEGWRLWASIGLILLLVAYCVLSAATVARSAEARASVRRQFANFTDAMPHTRPEMHRFVGVALTAGFCEEFLFRGYFIWAFIPWLDWWGAAALSVLCFAGAHAYQGWNSALRTGIVGVFFTLVVAIFGSLWPAIVLHVLLDLGMGIIAWLALREGPATGSGEVEVEK